MTVCRTVVDEQHKVRRRQALDKSVEQGLALAIDPVQVLEDQEERPLARFAQQKLPECLKCAVTALRRIECVPLGIVHRYVDQGQQRRERRLHSAVEREQLAGHLLPDFAELVPVLDLEVTLEEIDHRQVARRLSIGDRGALQNQPALRAVRMGELPEETRFADARLSDHGDHLAAALARPVEGISELLQLRVAANKARKPALRGGLEAGAGGPGSYQLEHLDRFNEALYRHWPERGDLDDALHQSQRLTGDLDSAWRRQLLHARRHVCGSAYC